MKLKKMLFGLVLLGGASAASANSILISTPTINSSNPGYRDFTYTVSLTFANEVAGTVGNPDFVTLYDFQGFSGLQAVTGLLASDFTFSTALSGPTPSILFPVQVAADHPNLPNLTFTANTGVTIDNNSGADMVLGTFTARTVVVNPIQDNPVETYVYQDTTRVNLGNGNFVVSVKGQDAHNTTVPFNDQGPFVTPVPATACGGLGLLSLLGLARRRRTIA